MKGRKSLIIASAVMIVAAGTMTGVYMNQQKEKEEKPNLVAKATEQAEESTQEDRSSQTAAVDSIIPPYPAIVQPQKEEETDSEQETKEEEAEEANAVVKPEPTLNFSEETTMNWPLQGSVIMNYSMDKTVYFATLDQYKYNPGVVISGVVNDRVSCAAEGKITDISTNERTGCTVTMDLGNGYTAIYGQLKQVPYEVGDVVGAGKLVGYIAEPTKYYSVEGSNLYFAVEKDGTPVNPVSFFE